MSVFAKAYTGIGLMSGTSLDGIDLACCTFRETGGKWAFDVEIAETIPFDAKWLGRLSGITEQSGEIFAKTQVYFGHYLGQIVADFIQRHQLKPDFVASHGQTIYHQPHKNFTCQIGDGETMVTYLDCPLVTNFRNKDVAMKGQGAPLVPFGEQHLFPDHQLFLNLGGFANITANGRAWDIAGCNLVLNWLAAQHDSTLSYDPEGTIARSGTTNPFLLDRLNRLDYYQQAPPKSLGTEWLYHTVFPLLDNDQISVEDRANSYVKHLAHQIYQGLKDTGITRQPLLITGGGALNQYLMEILTNELAPLEIHPDHSISDEIVHFKEAIIFAFLGLNTLLGRPNTLSRVTGARTNVCAGSIHLPAKGGYSLL